MNRGIPITNDQRDQLIRAVLHDEKLTDKEAWELYQLLDPMATRKLFDVCRGVNRRSPKPLSEDNASDYVMQNNPIVNLLGMVAAKAYKEAESLEKMGRVETAKGLKELGDTLAFMDVPGEDYNDYDFLPNDNWGDANE